MLEMMPTLDGVVNDYNRCRSCGCGREADQGAAAFTPSAKATAARHQPASVGADEGDARVQAGTQGIDARQRSLVFGIAAVLRVAQMGKDTHTHQALLQPLHRVQAGQQGGSTLAQPPLVGVHLGARGIQGFELGLPLRSGGEQVIQVPGQFDRNVGARKTFCMAVQLIGFLDCRSATPP
jgi:hypothetical protein